MLRRAQAALWPSPRDSKLWPGSLTNSPVPSLTWKTQTRLYVPETASQILYCRQDRDAGVSAHLLVRSSKFQSNRKENELMLLSLMLNTRPC